MRRIDLGSWQYEWTAEMVLRLVGGAGAATAGKVSRRGGMVVREAAKVSGSNARLQEVKAIRSCPFP